MSDLKEKLDCPVTYCSSSSETYKGLQDHMVRKNTKNTLMLHHYSYIVVFLFHT